MLCFLVWCSCGSYQNHKKLTFSLKPFCLNKVLPEGRGGYSKAKVVATTLNTFMASADREITSCHVPCYRVKKKGDREMIDPQEIPVWNLWLYISEILTLRVLQSPVWIVFYCEIPAVCPWCTNDLEQNEGSKRETKRRLPHDPWRYADCEKSIRSSHPNLEAILHVHFMIQVTWSYGSSKSQNPSCLTSSTPSSSMRLRIALQVEMRSHLPAELETF